MTFDREAIDVSGEHVFVSAHDTERRSVSIGLTYTPASAARSALMIVLAAPVSTSTFVIWIDTPEYVSVAVTNARSCRKVSCTQPPDPQPQPFFELEFGLARVHEAELAVRMLATKLPVSLHRCSTVGARLDDPNAIEDAAVVRAVRLECLDNEPLVGMRRADLAPPHAMTLTGDCDSGQFLDRADRRLRVDLRIPRRASGSTRRVAAQRAFQLGEMLRIWWRRRESNPRPEMRRNERLRV